MKHTEKEMLERTKKVLSDLHGVYFKEENIIKIVYHENDEVARPSGEIMNTWTGVLNEPLFDASEFLIISDETGEPLYYQNANMIVYEIKKDDKGNYY